MRVTLVLEKMSPGPRRWLELACLAIAAVAVGYLAFWACRFTHESWQFNELAQGLWAVPIWIPQLSFALGALLHHLTDTRVERLSGGEAQANDAAGGALLVTFIAGGLRAAMPRPRAARAAMPPSKKNTPRRQA